MAALGFSYHCVGRPRQDPAPLPVAPTPVAAT
jgi:hypothetical protein